MIKLLTLLFLSTSAFADIVKLATFKEHPAKIMQIVSASTLLISSDEEGNIIGWNLATKSKIWQTHIAENLAKVQVFSLSVSRDGKFFAAGGMFGYFGVFNALTGEPVFREQVPNSIINLVVQSAFSIDRKNLFLQSALGFVFIYSLESKALINQFEFPAADGKQFWISDNNRWIASVNKDPILILNANDGTLVKGLRPQSGPAIQSAVISPDLRFVAMATANAVEIVSLEGGRMVQKLELPTDSVQKKFSLENLAFDSETKLSGVQVQTESPYAARMISWEILTGRTVSTENWNSWIVRGPSNTQWGWYQSEVLPKLKLILTADPDLKSINVWGY